MRRPTLAAVLLLSSCISTLGQNMKQELDGLRGQLDLPESTHIVMATSPGLPIGSPLKVFLGVGFEMELRKNLTDRVTEWNTKDGKQYGLIELVSDITQADVVLAKYVEEKVNNKTGSATNVTTGSTMIFTTSYVEVYEYVIVQKSSGLEIQWREAKEVIVRRSRSTGNLWDSFTKLMKSRTRSEKATATGG